MEKNEWDIFLEPLKKRAVTAVFYNSFWSRILTSAWKEETEKIPRRASAALVGRLAVASRLLGLGNSPPCKLAR